MNMTTPTVLYGGGVRLIEMCSKTHWEQIYQDRLPEEVGWYQAEPRLSLKLIQDIGLDQRAPIIDVGGGASVLVDHLLAVGYSNLTVLDLSGAAIGHAKNRLGPKARRVKWVELDVTDFQASHPFELWHDRAVFHFLIDVEDRRRYVQVLKKSLIPGGHLVIATFAVGGPTECSGLRNTRYDADSLSTELGDAFVLREQIAETHITPSNIEQKFAYFRFQKKR